MEIILHTYLNWFSYLRKNNVYNKKEKIFLFAFKLIVNRFYKV